MRQIAIFGAFDRFNYGDMLFPIILEKIFNNYPDYKIEYYGIIKSDLSVFGGKKTKSFEDLVNKNNLEDGSIVVIAGGEVLATDWFNIFRYLMPENLINFTDMLQRNIPQSILNKISPKIRGKKYEYPYVLAPEDFDKRVRVIYNAVGGVGLKSLSLGSHQINLVKKKLSKASFVSVRDNATLEALSSYAYSFLPNLSPDCATLISNYFSREFLLSKLRPELKKWIKRHNNCYVTFQIKKRFANDEFSIKLLVDQIESLYISEKLPAVLCPIGTAAYHQDQVPLYLINERIKTPVFIAKDFSIYEIMGIIANSKLFIGSSLHGAITAMSYAIPNLVIPDNLHKLQSYLDTWALPPLNKSIQMNMIAEEAERALSVPQDKLENKKQELIDLTEKSFNLLRNVIMEDESSPQKEQLFFTKINQDLNKLSTLPPNQIAELAFASYEESEIGLTRKLILKCLKSDFRQCKENGLLNLLILTYFGPRPINYLNWVKGMGKKLLKRIKLFFSAIMKNE